MGQCGSLRETYKEGREEVVVGWEVALAYLKPVSRGSFNL